MSYSPAHRGALVAIAGVAFWGFILWRGLVALSPSSDLNVIDFNSDSAIPVLMANDDRPITIFNFYYYGADRWGAWGLLVAQIVRRVTGHYWTPESLTRLQVVWVFAGALLLAGLIRRDRVAAAFAGTVYLCVLCLHRQSDYYYFELSQLYAWQTTSVLLAWFCMRCLCDTFVKTNDATDIGDTSGGARGSGDSSPRSVRARITWFVLTLGGAYLAIWSSAASAFFLAMLAVIEATRVAIRKRSVAVGKGSVVISERGVATRKGAGLARAERADRADRTAPAAEAPIGWRQPLAALAMAISAIVAAGVIEQMQKGAYQRYSVAHYHNPYSTTFGVDSGYLAKNVTIQFDHLAKLAWWPWYALPTLAALILLVALTYALVGRRHQLLAAIERVFVDDLAVLALSTYSVALLNLALAVIVDHVRKNDYSNRYLALTNLFGPISGMLTLFLLVSWLVSRLMRAPSTKRFAQPARYALLLGAMAMLVLRFPVPSRSEHYTLLKDTAQLLSTRMPRGVLMGAYWDTYVFSALQPEGQAMTPVPFHNHEFRTPWTSAAAREAPQIVVSWGRDPIGNVPPAPSIMEQHGQTLRLLDAQWYVNRDFVFSLYENETWQQGHRQDQGDSRGQGQNQGQSQEQPKR
jgi:hypothetical protein